jgi:hypothetical protein
MTRTTDLCAANVFSSRPVTARLAVADRALLGARRTQSRTSGPASASACPAGVAEPELCAPGLDELTPEPAPDASPRLACIRRAPAPSTRAPWRRPLRWQLRRRGDARFDGGATLWRLVRRLLDCQVATGWVGVSPWRRIVSPSAARSGGPPAAAARTWATSLKWLGPNTPGVAIARNFVSTLPRFSKPCDGAAPRRSRTPTTVVPGASCSTRGPVWGPRMRGIEPSDRRSRRSHWALCDDRTARIRVIPPGPTRRTRAARAPGPGVVRARSAKRAASMWPIRSNLASAEKYRHPQVACPQQGERPLAWVAQEKVCASCGLAGE